jgi:hypothetical protein
MEAKKNDIAAAVDLAKNIGVVIGGLGSLAALLYWIGNAIILARLQEYNLYGIVHYTDEYVKEAGFQFIQDVFTFFQSWPLVLLFLLATGFVIAFIPVGPFGGALPERPKSAASPRLVHAYLVAPVAGVKKRGLHYLLFLAFALAAGVMLTANWSVKNLSSDIMRQERILKKSLEQLQTPLFLFPAVDLTALGEKNEFQKRFYADLTRDVPERGWNEAQVRRSLAQLGYPAQDGKATESVLARLQQVYRIEEAPVFRYDGDFEASTTHRVIRGLLVNQAINKDLYQLVQAALADIQSLKGHLESEEDLSSLVIVPANYKIVNASINRIRGFRKNLLALFKPGDDATSRFLNELLDGVKPLRFGSTLLSYSFLVLIGLLAYLLMNVPRLLAFSQWERGYFVLMLLLFIVIAITLPTAYGRYKFEFNVKKLTDLRLAAPGGGDRPDPVKQKLDELLQKGVSLYILGPTKGQEVIIGALTGTDTGADTAEEELRIIMLDRDLLQFMVIQPVQAGEIPRIIGMLKMKKRQVRL